MQLKQLRVREGSARAGTEPHDTLDARLRHDIRQSLAALRALAAVVEAEVAEDAGVAERLRLICHEVDWIAELVSSSGSTDGDQDFSVVDVGAVVASTCSSVSLSAGCDVRIVQEPAVMALTDETALRRSTRNLVDNAVRAAGPDGTVEVAVRREGSRAVLEVSDDGPGFGRVPTQQGLGLVTVRRFVSRVRGTLDIGRSRLGGARLTLSMPTHVGGLVTQRHSA
jgi:signal transduction histidine kinase